MQGGAGLQRGHGSDQVHPHPQLGDVLCWGMVDRYSWLNGFDPRKDGTRKRGTPYDANFRPKRLRDAIATSFAGAKTRHA